MRPSVYRAGPWPGVTPRGAVVLLGCGLLLGVMLAAIEPLAWPWPDLVVLGAASLIPLALAVRITRVPGAASAACGAYLLPRTLASVLVRGLDPPPLLLVASIAFDACLWLRLADLAALREVWPSRRRRWSGPRRAASLRYTHADARGRIAPAARSVAAGAVYGVALAAVVPPWSTLLGADPTPWSGSPYLIATAVTVAVDGMIAVVVLCAQISDRGTES